MNKNKHEHLKKRIENKQQTQTEKMHTYPCNHKQDGIKNNYSSISSAVSSVVERGFITAGKYVLRESTIFSRRAIEFISDIWYFSQRLKRMEFFRLLSFFYTSCNLFIAHVSHQRDLLRNFQQHICQLVKGKFCCFTNLIPQIVEPFHVVVSLYHQHET